MSPNFNEMKNTSIVVISCLLLFSYGCKKDSEDDHWKINDLVVTFKLEYNTFEQLTKYSELRNDSLFEFYTYDYSDTSLTEKRFDKNSEENGQTIFMLDTNGRGVKSYPLVNNNIDTIIYSPSGFLNSISVENVYPIVFSDNGSEIISESIDMHFITFTPSEIISKVSLPDRYSLNVVPLFTGYFGATNQHLFASYTTGIAGPGGSITRGSFEYEFDSDGYVTQVKKYEILTYRNQPEPKYGTISYVNYEYHFE